LSVFYRLLCANPSIILRILYHINEKVSRGKKGLKDQLIFGHDFVKIVIKTYNLAIMGDIVLTKIQICDIILLIVIIYY